MMSKPTFFTFCHKGRLKALVHFCKTTRRLTAEDDDLTNMGTLVLPYL